MKTAAFLAASASAALWAGAGLAQHDAAPAADPHAGLTMPDDPPRNRPAALGFAPMLLEVGPGETIGLPRSYDQRPCGDALTAKLFSGPVEQDFIDSLRCWAVPVEHSEDFAQTLDQAVSAAGWTYAGAAGQIVHYRRGSQQMDIRVFWLGDYMDEETQDRGFLFGVVGERGADATE